MSASEGSLPLLALPITWTNSLRAQAILKPDADPRIEKIATSISEQRILDLLTTRVGFGTRETMSTARLTTRGIGAARQWIFDELSRSSPRLQVSLDTYHLEAQSRITRSVAAPHSTFLP